MPSVAKTKTEIPIAEEASASKPKKRRGRRKPRGAFEIGNLKSDIPPPSRSKANKIPFGDFLVGQSLDVNGLSLSTVYAASQRWLARNPQETIKFTLQEIDENTVRIWRLR